MRVEARAVRIGVVAPVWFPVPPTGYGGIEWVVWLLAEGLVEAGHDVTLFASGESRTKAKLEYVFAEAPSEEIGRTFTELHHLMHCYARQDEFDLINDHTGLMGLVGRRRPADARRAHGARPGRRRPRACSTSMASKVAPNVGLISISMNQRKPKPGLNWIANCPNALDFDLYPYAPHRGDYLLFVGRMAPDKGAHRAVRTAMEAGLPLKLCGKMREPLEIAYFDEFVRPHLTSEIEYLGEVRTARRSSCSSTPARRCSRSSGRSRSAW